MAKQQHEEPDLSPEELDELDEAFDAFLKANGELDGTKQAIDKNAANLDAAEKHLGTIQKVLRKQANKQ